MGGVAFRKEVLHAVGGFNDFLQFFEWNEIDWRLTKAGFSGVVSTVKFTHLENEKRFTLKGHFKTIFDYNYWWHLLFWLRLSNPPKILYLTAWPLKFLIFLTLLIFSFFSAVFLILLSILCILFFAYRLNHNLGNLLFCLRKFPGKDKKMSAFLIIILVIVIDTFVADFGKLYSFFNRFYSKVTS